MTFEVTSMLHTTEVLYTALLVLYVRAVFRINCNKLFINLIGIHTFEQVSLPVSIVPTPNVLHMRPAVVMFSPPIVNFRTRVDHTILTVPKTDAELLQQP